MTSPLTHAKILNPGADAPDTGQAFLGDLRLRAGRVHEFCGPARWTLALALAGRTSGEVFWISPSWGPPPPNPDGFAPWVAPSRITFLAPTRPDDILWCLEEVLRAGAVGLAVADLPEAPGLTPVRRLHLAAGTSGLAPLGVLLTPGQGGAGGVESRWSL
ncbi:hypothetical protein, partial [Oceaniglobus roseus]|uniref:hypothetical protein n=1 Tax=Oceaniglobus roseus TaxID=1737570 RepID=UPI000C7F2F57